jgi:serine/threonine-protein kinase
MAAVAADRHLLLGLLALQTGLIQQAQLVAAFHAWTCDKSRSLADHLVAQGHLSGAGRTAVEALAAVHIEAKGGVEQSLAAVPASEAFRASLARLGDADIDATLDHAGAGGGSTTHNGPVDPDRTAEDSVGTPTSDGQRFRVLRPHARGGLGTVLVALDRELDREVALKRILDEHADEPHSRARFLLEAQVTGGLEHPGIVPVYGLGAYADGRPYYAMRLIRGDSLMEAIRRFHDDGSLKEDAGRRSLEFRKLLRRFVDVCNAIDYAHGRGVIHRDIKPRNVVVGKYGETLVVDWGLAKVTGKSGPGAGEPTLRPAASGSSETLPGSALGTPAYMSPEQAAGDLERLSPRSDIYGLGATLYCLLTGKPPFEGEDVGSILCAVQEGRFPRPTRLDSSLDPALEAVCLKAIALRPPDRYASPRLLAEDVERWMADEPVSAWREPWAVRARRWMRRRRTAVTAAGVLLVATVIGLTVGTIMLGRAEERTRRQRDAAREQRRLADQNFRLARRAVDEYFVQVSENTLLDTPVPGMQPLRKELLQTALRYYREFQALHRDDPSLRADLARACYRIGYIQNDVGTAEQALTAFEEARSLGESLIREDPADLAIRYDLARSARSVGTVLYRQMGRQAEGLEQLQRALVLAESLVRDRPDDPEFQTELVASYADLGRFTHNRRLTTPELPFLEKASAIAARLARSQPSHRHRYDEARILYLIGIHYHGSIKATEALAHYDRAREILERLHRDRPSDVDVADLLAMTSHAIGRVHRSITHRTEAAGDALRQARRLFGELAGDNPAVVHFRFNRDDTDFMIGTLLTSVGRYAEAEAVLRPALDDGERIIASDPSDISMATRLADAEIEMGKALHGLSRAAESLVPLARGRDLLEVARARDPGDLQSLVSLARCIRYIGFAQAEIGRRVEAIETLSDSVRMLEDSSEEDRRRHFSIVPNLAVICTDLGELQQQAGRLRDAEQTLLKVEGLGHTYSGEGGRPRLDPYWLIPTRVSLGLLWKDIRRSSEARDVLQKAEATCQAIPEQSVVILQCLAAIESALAELAAPGVQRQEYDHRAAEYFRRAATAAEPGDLAELARQPRYARLRARPDLAGLLQDRLFPANPFVP